jgi:hypothetical protein
MRTFNERLKAVSNKKKLDDAILAYNLKPIEDRIHDGDIALGVIFDIITKEVECLDPELQSLIQIGKYRDLDYVDVPFEHLIDIQNAFYIKFPSLKNTHIMYTIMSDDQSTRHAKVEPFLEMQSITYIPWEEYKVFNDENLEKENYNPFQGWPSSNSLRMTKNNFGEQIWFKSQSNRGINNEELAIIILDTLLTQLEQSYQVKPETS